MLVGSLLLVFTGKCGNRSLYVLEDIDAVKVKEFNFLLISVSYLERKGHTAIFGQKERKLTLSPRSATDKPRYIPIKQAINKLYYLDLEVTSPIDISCSWR